MLYSTREEWLNAASHGLGPLFTSLGRGIVVPIRISMGFPSSRALSLKKRTIGECWAVEASADGSAQIMISPLLDDRLEILGVVAHELGHAVLGHKVGHRAPFGRLMKDLGLEGKATATTPGPLFEERTAQLLHDLGPLPHVRLDPNLRLKKKDTIRQLKGWCEGCGYVARTSQKWLDAGGPPICPTCRETMMTEDKE